MSITVKLENATVTKELGNTGYQVEVPIPGQEWKRKFAVWSTEIPPIGATFTVTGALSWKTRAYEMNGETRHTVDMNVNDPIVSHIMNVTDEIPF